MNSNPIKQVELKTKISMKSSSILLIWRFLLGALFVGALMQSCSRKSAELYKPVDPEYSNYVSSFTSGMVSKRTSITVHLMEEHRGVEPGQEIEEELFDFSPSLKGKTYWRDAYTIEFVPEDPLHSGTFYEGAFKLSKVVGEIPSKLHQLPLQFRAIPQELNVRVDGMQAMGSEEMIWQKVVGTVLSSDYVSADELESCFNAQFNDEQKKISWVHSEDGKTHSFSIDSVSRSKNTQEVFLNWDAENIQSESEGETRYDLPPLGDFKVMDVKVIQGENQHIEIYFSDPLDKAQNLQGIVRLPGVSNLRLEKAANIVRIFPNNTLSTSYTLTIENSIKNKIGYTLKERYEREIIFEMLKPAVELIGEGVILPADRGVLFPFKAVNLNAVQVKVIKVFTNNITQFFQNNQYINGNSSLQRVGRIVYRGEVPLQNEEAINLHSWNSFTLNLADLIEVEPGAIYRVELGFDKRHSVYPCQAESSDEEEIDWKARYERIVEKEEQSYDNPSRYYYYYDSRYYNYDYYQKDQPCSNSYFLYSRKVSRNVFASNLGIIAKGGEVGAYTIAVSDISTASPQSEVEIELFNYQNQLIASTTTNQEGLAELDLSKKPFLLVAKKGDQRGYLRLDQNTALSLSMFDVGGMASQDGLKGYIYGERGVWRPGDSLYLNFVLEDQLENLPESHPVVMEIYTPRNQLYQRIVRNAHVNRVYDFRTATDPDAPTGNWLAKVKVGGSSFSKSLKIETVKPNRLKINLDFGKKVLKSTESLEGDLQVNWLHGAPGKNLKADVNLNLSGGHTSFKNFAGYEFDDPAKEFHSEEISIFNGNVNNQGFVKIYPNIGTKESAPGMLKATFKIRAFEKGGDFSVDQFSMNYSPYNTYVGLKIPEGTGWGGAHDSQSPILISLASVDESGNPISRSNLKVEVYKINWRWWWDRNNESLASYVGDHSHHKIKTEYVSTTNGKGIYELKLDNPSWGRKLVRITDTESGHTCGTTFYTTYSSWYKNGENPSGAEMLTFSLDKKKYSVGEEVQVQLPNAENGRALVSIENGTKTLRTFWVDIRDEKSFSFKTTSDMSPNAYVNISLVQPRKTMNNDLPIRLYGVQPVFVEDPSTHLKPVIACKSEWEPESEVDIHVNEKEGKKMTYTLAVVDDGLLDLTRFKTPNPWHHFYAREALGVKTWDMYKYVMGSFTGQMAGLLALGGDQDLAKPGGQKANRFKPVVRFIGPFELEAGGKATHTIKMPNYVGSVRVMVVSSQDGSYGSSEKTVKVKKPLMMLATMPRVVSPAEQLALPVHIFAMDKKVKNVEVSLKTNNAFTIQGKKSKNMSFSSVGDETVYFDLSVNKKVGIGKVWLEAKSAGEIAKYTVEIDVRLANPKITKTETVVIDAGKTWEGNYTPIGIEGTNEAVLEVSRMPSLNLENRLQYLIRYPHGCIEQTTSSVFPQLFVKKLLELPEKQQKEIEYNVKTGIERLKQFQVSSGGFSYWPGGGEASEWGSNYAGHFILEAKSVGYVLPYGMLKNWVSYQTTKANSWTGDHSENLHYYNSSDLIQAYRLYTLAVAGEPAFGAMNRMKEQGGLQGAAAWRLALAYYISGKKQTASSLVASIPNTKPDHSEYDYRTYGSETRDLSMMLEAMVYMNQMGKGKELLDDVVDKFKSQRWMSTQTTAYSLLAITRFFGEENPGDPLKYSYSTTSVPNTNVEMKTFISTSELPADKSGFVRIKNRGSSKLFVQLIRKGNPIESEVEDSESNLTMTVDYMDMDGNTISVEDLSQGTDFIAQVKITHPGSRGSYHEMALNQMFPSGWEIRNTRMDLADNNYDIDRPEYQDIRDDRVYSYFDLPRNESVTYRVLLHAAYEGTFYLPSVYCEAMYDNKINAIRKGKWVKVSKPGATVSMK